MPSSFPPDTPSNLIAMLCLEAGRIMEDTSFECALSMPNETADLATRLQRIAQAGEDIATLAAAAAVLHRRRI